MIIFKIHPLYWMMALICTITGLFKNFILFSILIIVHEFGHLLGAIIYKWNVKKVVILPIGGVTIFNEVLSKSLFEEFIILIFGPLFQIIFYFLYIKIFGFNSIIYNYHYALLLFNLLPIFPLDGFKLLNLLFNKLFSFKMSHFITIIISFITIFFVFFVMYILNFNFIFLLAIIFLLIKNIREFMNHNLIFNKFLLERYLYKLNLKRTKVIESNDFKKMKREYKHIFHYNNKYETEKTFLIKKFDITKKVC